MKTVAQVLEGKRSSVISVAPDATVFVALQLMAEKEVGAVVVLMVTGSSGVLVAVASPPRFLAVKARMCR